MRKWLGCALTEFATAVVIGCGVFLVLTLAPHRASPLSVWECGILAAIIGVTQFAYRCVRMWGGWLGVPPWRTETLFGILVGAVVSGASIVFMYPTELVFIIMVLSYLVGTIASGIILLKHIGHWKRIRQIKKG